MSNKQLNARRKRHHLALASLHESPKTANGLTMFRALRRLEQRAAAANAHACNTPEGAAAQDGILASVREEIKAVFGGVLPWGFFINRDPRGYALKIDNEDGHIPDGLGRDWGGYGILAQEIK